MSTGTPTGGPAGADPPSSVQSGGTGQSGATASDRLSPSFGGTAASSIAQMDAMSRLLAENWWAVALRGVFGILFGIIAFVSPAATMLALALVFAGYLLADGVFGIISAVRAARAHERWGLLLAEGVLNILMGVIAALFPVGAVLAFVIVTAAWALLTGGLMVGAAFKLNVGHGRWWLVLSGILSILWGLLLAISPLIGAVVLTWWLGSYAIVFGVLLLILAFRLRGERDRPTGGALAQGA